MHRTENGEILLISFSTTKNTNLKCLSFTCKNHPVSPAPSSGNRFFSSSILELDKPEVRWESPRRSEYGVYCPFRHRYRPRLDSPLTGDRGQDDWSLEALVWVDLWVVPVLGGGSRGPGGRTDVMERARGWTRAPWPGQWHFPLPVLNSDQWTHCLRHSCHSTAFPSIKGCCFCSQWHINSY